MLLPLWALITLAILFLVVVFLLWRLRNCKCSLYETFETADAAEKDVSKTKDETDAVEEDTKATDAEVVVKKPEKEVVLTEEDESTDAVAPKATEKKKDTKTMADKFMEYGEMKIFDNLRDNAYSLQDIKRMIREGEINQKMIEKFLARVEKMEDRVETKKTTETTVEGFSSGRGAPMYANAFFS